MMKRVEKNKNLINEVDGKKERRIRKSTECEKEKNDNSINKKGLKVVKIILIILLITVAFLYYIRFIEPKMLFVKEVKVESEFIPEDLSGVKLVQFSDLHYMMTTGGNELKRMVDKINEIRPDIVVFTGDLLDSDVSYDEDDYDELIKYLTNVDASLGKYYVKGNHDYYTDKVDYILSEAYFISLNNGYDIIYGDTVDTKMIINGMGSFIENDFDSKKAFSINNENVFTISLFHEPDGILELRDKHIDLALAGHSHNSQIRLPIISKYLTVDGAKTYYKNYYNVNGTHLYVNSGIGTSIYRIRLFAPPTINLYRLVSK